ncbi:MAG: HNH endonuclease [Candidatus Nealsonbacteria bacterium]
MENLTSFSIYDTLPPKGMSQKLFRKYMSYKEFGRKANQSDSIEKRFNIILSEYKRIFPKIRYKDKIRLFNEEQKIRIYFRQKCLCYFCKKPLDFSRAQCHHKDEHAKGGPTKIKHGRMVHITCHGEFHKKKK